METPKTLYFTDGCNVTVTGEDFQVKNVNYPIAGIFSHRVHVVMPQRGPFTVLTALGAFVFICGAFDFLPADLSKSISLYGVPVVANGMIMVLGIVVMFLGMFAMFHLRDKYVFKVSTPSGEKTALVSHKREYVNQIIDALNHAHLNHLEKLDKKP